MPCRDALLCSILDGVRASGNRDVCVKMRRTNLGWRLGPLYHQVHREGGRGEGEGGRGQGKGGREGGGRGREGRGELHFGGETRRTGVASLGGKVCELLRKAAMCGCSNKWTSPTPSALAGGGGGGEPVPPTAVSSLTGRQFVEAVNKINANVAYSGLNYAVTQDGLFVENKEKLINAALTALISKEGELP